MPLSDMKEALLLRLHPVFLSCREKKPIMTHRALLYVQRLRNGAQLLLALAGGFSQPRDSALFVQDAKLTVRMF